MLHLRRRPSIGRPVLVAAALAATQLTLVAGQAAAQRRGTSRGSVTVRYDDDYGGRRGPAVSMLVGTFRSDLGSDASSPMASVRHEWPISRWLLSEVDASYARPRVTQPIVSQPGSTHEVSANAGGLDVSVQAQLPGGNFRPYIGLATGLFGYDEPNDGEKFVRPSQQVLGGIRFWLTDRLAFRGEGRVRFDTHERGYTAHNTEITGGFTVRY